MLYYRQRFIVLMNKMNQKMIKVASAMKKRESQFHLSPRLLLLLAGAQTS